jgi:hypothetical protein
MISLQNPHPQHVQLLRMIDIQLLWLLIGK